MTDDEYVSTYIIRLTAVKSPSLTAASVPNDIHTYYLAAKHIFFFIYIYLLYMQNRVEPFFCGVAVD